MAKKNIPVIERPNDALVVTKETFKKSIQEQIEKGQTIQKTKISNQEVLEKVQNDYKLWNSYNSEYLKHSFNNEDNVYRHDYDNVNFYTSSYRQGLSHNPVAEMHKKISNKILFLEGLLAKADLLKSTVEVSGAKTFPNTAIVDPIKDNQNVFIVHGHNHEIQQKVARTIEKLGLNPIILSEQASSGATVIEKFERHSNVGFAVVLLTSDDLGKAKAALELVPRARQNVILELGYFLGKLGRNRVLPLYEEGVEPPSDIHGVVYTLIDKAEKWKFEVVKELKAGGYEVDANKIL